VVYFLYHMPLRFEFDPVKSATNLRKHQIDFEAAQALWQDPDAIESPARSVNGEPRVALTGRIQQSLWTAIVTYRHDYQTIRLISVRRARRREKARYHDARADHD
jgi:uncharacterized protein